MIPRAYSDRPCHVGDTVEVDGGQGHHFARVLRVREGEPIAVVGKGRPFLGAVRGVDTKAGVVTVHLAQELPGHESRVMVYLVQGLAKGDKIETIVQKCTEVGVAGVAVVETARSVVRLKGDKAAAKVERWNKIAWEAASQSQRDVIPEVTYADSVKQLKPWLESLGPCTILMLDEDEHSYGLRAALRNPDVESAQRSIVLVVGPEGGFDDSERAIWTEAYGAHLVSMGPRIMRTETAGVVGVAAVLYEYGELGGS